MINYIIGMGAFLVVIFSIKSFLKGMKNNSCNCSCRNCPSSGKCGANIKINKKSW